MTGQRRRRRGAIALAAVLAAAAVAAWGCGGGGSGATASPAADATFTAGALVQKDGQLSGDERTALQQAVLARTAGHVFRMTNSISTTQWIDVQYGADGRIQFTRTSDPVHDTSVDPPRDGTATAVLEYTDERVQACESGADLGPKVLRWDNLFDHDFVSFEMKPRDVSDLRIAIDDPATKDLGWDASISARGFETPNGDHTATIWVSTDGVPLRTTTSVAPKGFYGAFNETEPRETLGPVAGLTPPECARP